MMAKLFSLVATLLVFHMALTSSATMYTVGDNSGWEISSDLDNWAMDKRFAAGDALVFQYPSSETVNEVTKENYDKCNTTNTIKVYTNGNTTVPLTKPGDRYFISGNRLYCLGGMKLHVTVDGDQAPVSAPQSDQPALPGSPSEKDDPSSIDPTSSAVMHGTRDMITIGFMGFIAIVFCVHVG